MSPRRLIVGAFYKVDARNFDVAVWNGDGFVGPREKFGRWFPDQEERYEDGGTVRSWKKLRFGSIDWCDLRPGSWSEEGPAVWTENRKLLTLLLSAAMEFAEGETAIRRFYTALDAVIKE